MERRVGMITAFCLAAALSACAGGGGGGGGPDGAGSVTQGPPPPPNPVVTNPGGGDDPNPPFPANAASFTSFAASPFPNPVAISGLGWSTTVSNYAAFAPTWSAAVGSEQILTLSPDSAWLQTPSLTLAIHPRDGALDYGLPGAPFKTYAYPYSLMDGLKGVVFADARALGWNYQTFGWWWGIGGGQGPSWTVGSFSVGAATPGASIPTAGSAVFNGRLAATTWQGSVASAPADVSAPMTLSVNFASRSAAFASADWSIGPTTYAGTGLSGQLTYGSQQNALSGVLTTANGQYSGPVAAQFFGPAAEEVGGAFVLAPSNDPLATRIVGGFGAKR